MTKMIIQGDCKANNPIIELKVSVYSDNSYILSDKYGGRHYSDVMELLSGLSHLLQANKPEVTLTIAQVPKMVDFMKEYIKDIDELVGGGKYFTNKESPYVKAKEILQAMEVGDE